MSDVQSRTISATVSDAMLATLWAQYTVAARRAQASLRMDDAHEAGKAWAAWLNAFAPVPPYDTAVGSQPKSAVMA